MDVLDCMRTRADVRSYKPDAVPDDLIEEVLQAATEAPSSGNIQNWEFIVVKRPETKQALVEAALGQDFIYASPAVIVVCANLGIISPKYGARGTDLYSVQNTSAAIQNMLLAAWNRGLATCWVGAFNENSIREILYIPANIRPVAIITLGYPAEKPKKQPRRPLKEVMHKEVYGGRL